MFVPNSNVRLIKEYFIPYDADHLGRKTKKSYRVKFLRQQYTHVF